VFNMETCVVNMETCILMVISRGIIFRTKNFSENVVKKIKNAYLYCCTVHFVESL